MLQVLIIILFSLYLSLFVFENSDFVLKYIHLKKDLNTLNKIYELNTSNKINFNSAYSFYRNQQEKNKNLKVFIGPSQNLSNNNFILPLSTFHNSKIVLCNESGKFITYNSDRFGFNNNDLEWNKQIFDVLLIGDSFAQGYCVDRENNILSNLRKNSENGFLNLASGGNGPLIAYASLLEYFPNNKKVKNVIWIITEGDLVNLSLEKDNNILMKYLKDYKYKQNLINYRDQINKILDKKLASEIKKNIKLSNENKVLKIKDTYENNLKKLIDDYNLLNSLKLRKTRSINFKEIFSVDKKINKNQNDVLFLKIVKNMKTFLDKKGANLHIFYISSSPNKKINDKILLLLNSEKIDFINIHKEIYISNAGFHDLFHFKRRIFGLTGHFNEKGYDLISKIIKREINF